MEILYGMAMAARRAGVNLPEFSLSPAESAQARQGERHRAAAAEADVSKSDLDRPDITVVTPSYRQLPWLRLCAASVQDQKGVRVEHIIQDADSGPELAEWVRTHTRARLHVESDFGMYDAINRGFRRARGGIIAWLNSDEQYLEGALRKVVDFFKENPDVDVLFGDALLINNLGQPISYRRAILPTLKHVQFSHLNTLSCSAFVRRSVVERGLLLDIRWKAIADAVWVAAMLEAGVRMATLSEPLAAFTITDKNLGQSSLAFTETERWQSQTGSNSPLKRGLYVAGHRFRKFRHGAYLPRHVVTKLYQLGDVEKRKLVEAKGLGFFWPGSE